MARRSKKEQARVDQYELAGFPAGAAKYEFESIGGHLRRAAEALAAQGREFGVTPYLTVASRLVALAQESALRGERAADRWQRADQERSHYPQKYRREP